MIQSFPKSKRRLLLWHEAFLNCESLTEINIPDSVSYLGTSAFTGCSSLLRLVIPETVTECECGVGSCASLVSLTFPSHAKSVGVGGCKNLTELIFPSDATSISVRNCESLTSLTIPDGVTELTPKQLEGNTGLKTVVIGKGVTSLNLYAFYNCPNITAMVIPSNVTEITNQYYKRSWQTMKFKNLTIYGEAGSTAETYAKQNGIPFVAGYPNENSVNAAQTASKWAQDEVTNAITVGLVPDDLQSNYQDNITRQEFCRLMTAVIEQSTGKTLAVPAVNPFTDTTDRHVLAAYRLGIVNGTSATTFNPNGTITRQEAAAMLARTARVLGLSAGDGMSFADADQIAGWAKEDVSFVSALTDAVSGSPVMNGTGNGNFSPRSFYTREQAYVTALRLFRA